MSLALFSPSYCFHLIILYLSVTLPFFGLWYNFYIKSIHFHLFLPVLLVCTLFFLLCFPLLARFKLSLHRLFLYASVYSLAFTDPPVTLASLISFLPSLIFSWTLSCTQYLMKWSKQKPECAEYINLSDEFHEKNSASSFKRQQYTNTPTSAKTHTNRDTV